MLNVNQQTKERFETKFTPGKPAKCWDWPPSKSGQPQFWFEKRNINPQRIAFAIANPDTLEKTDKLVATCGNKLCVNPAHLVAEGKVSPSKAKPKAKLKAKSKVKLKAKPKAKSKVKLKVKLKAKPKAKPKTNTKSDFNVKLDAPKVRRIRKAYPKTSMKDLAVKFGVTRNTIYDVVKMHTWKNV